MSSEKLHCADFVRNLLKIMAVTQNHSDHSTRPKLQYSVIP